jgi:hypothetical protein
MYCDRSVFVKVFWIKLPHLCLPACPCLGTHTSSPASLSAFALSVLALAPLLCESYYLTSSGHHGGWYVGISEGYSRTISELPQEGQFKHGSILKFA